MANNAIRRVLKNSDYVTEGLLVSPGSGDAVNVSAGTIVIKGQPKSINAETNLALTAPSGSGEVRRNYIRILKASPFTISAYATASGATVTAIDTDYLDASSSQSPDSQNHYLYNYLAYVDIDETPGVSASDITDWRPMLGRPS
jgi:hypothetical protein